MRARKVGRRELSTPKRDFRPHFAISALPDIQFARLSDLSLMRILVQGSTYKLHFWIKSYETNHEYT